MAYRDGELQGVGGWLAFFLVTLGIISPLAILATTGAALAEPGLASAYGDVWPTLRAAEWGIAGLCAVLCLHAVWRFLMVHEPQTVRIGIATLWTVSIISLIGEPLVVAAIAGIEFGRVIDAMAGPELIRPLVYSTLWTAYLLKSERVRNTYYADGEADEI